MCVPWHMPFPKLRCFDELFMLGSSAVLVQVFYCSSSISIFHVATFLFRNINDCGDRGCLICVLMCEFSYLNVRPFLVFG
mmetsp:Transcript_10286/g.15447  ORF Transcript_10286/g.15447 Transcript_10286/m.15447 type:complete len:80 (-) Transcript_10286:402-641(-)